MGTLTIRGATSGNVSLTVPSTIPANVSFVLPSADGTTGQVLVTDGAGALSFTSPVTQANLTSAATAANTPSHLANSAAIYANGAFAAANSADDFTAINSGYWSGSAPTTVQTAVNRLANLVYTLNSSTPIP